MGPEEHRQHPRFRVSLRAHLALPGGTVAATTLGVSRNGMSVRLAPPLPAPEQEVPVTLVLPSGTSIDGRAVCKNHLPGNICGMSLEFAGDAAESWEIFVDEEEQTGSLWRMIGRMARAPHDALAPRGLSGKHAEDELRFHTVGENGEAYRVAFEQHTADPPEASDLVQRVAGFVDVAHQQVLRVLREAMHLSFDEGDSVVPARVVELTRGGYAYVQEAPVGLVALCVGELVLVEKNGAPVFPRYSADDLERIACDTFRRDLQRPVFARPRGMRPAPVALPPLPEKGSTPPTKFQEGVDAVRFAQAAADDGQMRVYGERQIWFHPSVWARVNEAGTDLMGPTLQDGDNVCVLALVGPGAPRVVKLDAGSRVKVLKPPARAMAPPR